jgi:H+/Cl- antiporter ClcA
MAVSPGQPEPESGPADAPPPAPASVDPLSIIRSRAYVQALVLSAVIGVPVAAIAYGFLALIDWLQEFAYKSLPDKLGFDTVPTWWPLPLLTLAGVLVALCIRSLPGNCGHSPSEGFKTGGGPTLPVELPGVVLAALTTLGLGVVLGPEAPVIALGSGLGALAIRSLRKDAAPSAVAVIATAGSFAAISTLLGSPLLGAFLLMEASGLGGMMLGAALLPGMLSAGIGFLVFVGLDSITGQGTFSLAIPDLPPFTTPTVAMFGWALVFGLACPLLGWAIYTLARTARPFVHARRVAVTPVLGVAIALLAIVFAETTDHGVDDVLFSGQVALPTLIDQASTWSIGALVALIVCKGLAYGLSLSAFRGGPVFPSMFIGGAIGVMASHLPGMTLVPGLAIGTGAMCVTMLRLPFTSVLLATVLLASDSYAVMPLAIVAVVAAYVLTLWLPEPRALFGRVAPPPSPDEPADSPAANAPRN